MQVDSGVDDDTTTSENGAPAEQAKEARPDGKTNTAKKKKKARQKQKKAAGSLAGTGLSVTAKQNSKAQQVAPQPDEDIDQLLASLNITQAAVPEASTTGSKTAKPKADEPVLLGVIPAKLKADDEMRRIFGSRVVDAEARNGQPNVLEGVVGANRRVRRYSQDSCLAFCRLCFLLSCLSPEQPLTDRCASTSGTSSACPKPAM